MLIVEQHPDSALKAAATNDRICVASDAACRVLHITLYSALNSTASTF